MKLKKGLKVVLIVISVILGILLVINAYVLLAPQFGRNPDKERIAEMARLSKYEKGRFDNAGGLPVMLPKSQFKVIRKFMQSREGRIPPKPIPSVIPEFGKPGSSTLAFSWLGHSTVYIQLNGLTILTDPVFSERASPVNFTGPRIFEMENPPDPTALPQPDIIMLSHDHFDHLDHKAIRDHYREVSLFVVPLGVRDHLLRWGIGESQIMEFDWWQTETLPNGVSITAAPVQHFSGRRKQDNATLCNSWIISGEKHRVYFSGDSGYGDHFKTIGERFGPFDLALIECGAYGEFWPNIHMVPEESVRAGKDIQAKLVLPIHWGKFNLAFHPWDESIERFVNQATAEDLTYTTPLIGQQVQLDDELPRTAWWRF